MLQCHAPLTFHISHLVPAGGTLLRNNPAFIKGGSRGIEAILKLHIYKSPLAPLFQSGESANPGSEKIPPFCKGRVGGILRAMNYAIPGNQNA
ncbi:MAG: hypothetical protein B7Y56_07255 [Gallionellales bacterium 35-53-114]|nr:MAG: hypothetical protein B7Y56_07255 [Gallionellales bacterium 35-53-114]OZB09196.1 MAG: hypothetical protein B7X61_05860 [Gallionellales bacterium 39-52-133]